MRHKLQHLLLKLETLKRQWLESQVLLRGQIQTEKDFGKARHALGLLLPPHIRFNLTEISPCSRDLSPCQTSIWGNSPPQSTLSFLATLSHYRCSRSVHKGYIFMSATETSFLLALPHSVPSPPCRSPPSSSSWGVFLQTLIHRRRVRPHWQKATVWSRGGWAPPHEKVVS